jgi:DNA-binding transcriptional LysR family regulator
VDRFDDMRVFAKVVESGSFAGAATQLRISAIMVSQPVKELEERLGRACRTGRRARSAETGRPNYERCTLLLADLEETGRAVATCTRPRAGSCASNAATMFGILHLPRACRGWAEAGGRRIGRPRLAAAEAIWS